MSESYELVGVVKEVGETEVFGSNGFQKRQLVVTVGGDTDYPQDVAVEFVKDNVEKLDGLAPGMGLTVWFNIRSREYNGKYYTNLQGWRLKTDCIDSHNEAKGNGYQPQPDVGGEPEDDVPF